MNIHFLHVFMCFMIVIENNQQSNIFYSKYYFVPKNLHQKVDIKIGKDKVRID